MNTFISSSARAVAAGCLMVAANASAQEPRNVVDESNRPLHDASYIAVLPQYRISQDDLVLDKGFGGSFLVGYRNESYGFETGFGYSGESGVKIGHFIVNALWFPFDSIPMLYALVGGGASRYQDYPFQRSPRPVEGNDGFVTANLQGGLGYILPLRWGNYEYGVRLEGLYRVSDRFIERESDFQTDIAAPDTFKDVLINLGLHLPLRKLPPPPPEPAPVQLVESLPPADSDGDGVPDDRDQCPNTPAGEPVDTAGCPLPPPPPPCKAPEAGERISLEGCGTGDVIVLRGVNFDFNKSSLTANATTLLDIVAAELNEHTHISVEIGGHTDSKGADAYNQRLSEQRAQSVRGYLSGEGVAADRMTARGYGESQPVADNETEAGRELNRRVELKIVSAGGQPVRVQPAAPSAAAQSANEPAPASPEAPVAEDETVVDDDLSDLLAF